MKRKKIVSIALLLIFCSTVNISKVNAESYNISDIRVTNTNGQNYFSDAFGNAVTGFVYNDGDVFYSNNGHRQAGWVKDNNKWYYIDENCKLTKGLNRIQGKVYYFNQNGEMVLGRVTFSGNHTLYTDGNGVVVNFIPDMDTKLLQERIEIDNTSYSVTVENTNNPGIITTDDVKPQENNTSSSVSYVKYNELKDKDDDDDDDDDEYTIYYKDDNGDKLKKVYVDKGDKEKLYTPTKTGYKFVEWNTKKDGSGKKYSAGEKIKINSNKTLYAVWIKDTTGTGNKPDDNKNNTNNNGNNGSNSNTNNNSNNGNTGNTNNNQTGNNNGGTQTTVIKTALKTEIDAANANVNSVKITTDASVVLTTEKWVTTNDAAVFRQAITSAQTVYNEANATQNEVDTALAALKNAVNVFNGKKRSGTKIA